MKMSRLTRRQLPVCAALAIATQVHAGLRATPEFEDGSTRPASIALIPVHAQVLKAKVIQTESLVGESSELGGYLGDALAASLKARGYEVEVIHVDQVNSDARLREYVVDANRRYDELHAQLRSGRVKRRIYNAGDEARLLAEYLGVDAIAFTRLQVVAATGGRIAVALLVGVGTTGGTSATVGIIDGKSGDLEAYVSRVTGPNHKAIEEDPQGQMARIAGLIVDELPEAVPAAGAELSDEEDVLSEVESLLK